MDKDHTPYLTAGKIKCRSVFLLHGSREILLDGVEEKPQLCLHELDMHKQNWSTYNLNRYITEDFHSQESFARD